MLSARYGRIRLAARFQPFFHEEGGSALQLQTKPRQHKPQRASGACRFPLRRESRSALDAYSQAPRLGKQRYPAAMLDIPDDQLVVDLVFRHVGLDPLAIGQSLVLSSAIFLP